MRHSAAIWVVTAADISWLFVVVVVVVVVQVVVAAESAVAVVEIEVASLSALLTMVVVTVCVGKSRRWRQGWQKKRWIRPKQGQDEPGCYLSWLPPTRCS